MALHGVSRSESRLMTKQIIRRLAIEFHNVKDTDCQRLGKSTMMYALNPEELST